MRWKEVIGEVKSQEPTTAIAGRGQAAPAM